MQSHQREGFNVQTFISLVQIIDPATLAIKWWANKKPLNHGNDLTANSNLITTIISNFVRRCEIKFTRSRQAVYKYPPRMGLVHPKTFVGCLMGLAIRKIGEYMKEAKSMYCGEYLHDSFIEVLENHHTARLILTVEAKPPIKRDYLKYQKECRVQLKNLPLAR